MNEIEQIQKEQDERRKQEREDCKRYLESKSWERTLRVQHYWSPATEEAMERLCEANNEYVDAMQPGALFKDQAE